MWSVAFKGQIIDIESSVTLNTESSLEVGVVGCDKALARLAYRGSDWLAYRGWLVAASVLAYTGEGVE